MKHEKMIEDFVKQNEKELITLLETLVLIPAPSHKEIKRADFCRKWLDVQGINNVKMDDAGNVIYEYHVQKGTHNLMFMAHLDTVFPEETPLSIKHENGRISCPGISDDTVNAVILLLMMKYLHEYSPELSKGLILSVNVCEEGLGNLKGSRALIEEYEDRLFGVVSFDLYRDCIYTECIGSIRYKVKAVTKGGHSFGDFGKTNAIERMSKFIQELYAFKIPEGTTTTYNVGTIQGGTSVNTIAPSAEILFEYRSDSEEMLLKCEDFFHDIIRRMQTEEVRFSYEIVGKRPCMHNVDRNMVLRMAETCQRAALNVTGIKPVFAKASTDCNIPLSKGIPAICLGLCEGGGAHTLQEWLKESTVLEGLVLGLNVLYGLEEL
ncbi:MAG: M20/M25/M40 family metallo-hydrolase [Thermoflexaceae bacterium]|nr:M20/M25/M40 family metallo-hydrolase [Thermoflexaceae bacterium]